MGFFKKATTSYPARRNRINQQQHHPATVNPPAPSNYGAHDPRPMPSSVYQSNGIPVAPPAAATTATAAAFPSNNAPVQATVFVPGQSAATQVIVPAAPVMATAYNPGNASTQVHAATPVQATVYNPNATPSAPPAMNPMYENQSASFNNGNATYNSDESTYWECSVCTFPNLRTEPNCKGCGGAIPPGMLYSAASAASTQRPPQDTSYSSTMNGMSQAMNNLSMGGAGAGGPSSGGSSGTMRVHIPNGMLPGQKIKVRSPDGKEVVKVIPPQSEWHYDGAKPFFRMQFGAAATPAPVGSGSSYGGASYGGSSYGGPVAHEVPPPHSTSWREFHTRAPSHYDPPPIGTRSVPHSPRGGAGLPPNGRHKALIIGINYHRTRAELRGCINDAKNMQVMLQRNGYPNDGSHMLLLTDERQRGKEYQPTVQNIMKAFAWFMKDVRRGDVLFFHFSGHGGQVPDKTGHEIDGYNETIIPVDFERKGQITDDVLWGSLVYKLPEGARITALMDMCHSGTGLDLPHEYNVNTRQWKEDINPAHSQGDVVLFSGCEDAQTSADVAGMGRMAGGAMTQAFTRAYQSTGMSTYHEFLVAVKRELKKKRFSQRPQLTSSQQFDANNRIFSIGYQSSAGGIPSLIEPNHNPDIGRIKRRHVRPARQGFGRAGGGNDLFGFAGAAIGAALLADALF